MSTVNSKSKEKIILLVSFLETYFVTLNRHTFILRFVVHFKLDMWYNYAIFLVKLCDLHSSLILTRNL